MLEGWGVASDAGITVALELALTPELRSEGLARELIRIVQEARKAAGLDVSDRIALGIVVDGPAAEARDAHAALIAAETLATELSTAAVDGATYTTEADVEGRRVRLSLRRSGEVA